MGRKKKLSKVRTSTDLRNMLFEEIEQLRSDKISPQRAKATAQIATQITSSAKVDLDYHKFAASMSKKRISVKPLQLN